MLFKTFGTEGGQRLRATELPSVLVHGWGLEQSAGMERALGSHVLVLACRGLVLGLVLVMDVQEQAND